MESLKILFVEDLTSDVELNLREIKKNEIEFVSLVVETKEDYIKALTEFKPDIILSDYSLPKFNGMQALLIKKELTPLIPFILVTGSLNEETAVEIMKADADDYLLKENIRRLVPAMKSAIEKKSNLREKESVLQSLKESEERYRLILENSMDAILLTSQDGSILSANNSACEMFGMTEDELKLAGRNGIVDLKDTRLEKLLAERKEKGKAKGELNFIRKDKSKLSAEVSVSVFIDSKGEQKTSMVIRDITERKLSEATIIRERALFRTLIDNIPDAIYIKDKAGRKTLANPQDLKNMGCSFEEEVLGKTDAEFFSKEDAIKFMSDDNNVFSGKSVLDREESFVDRDGNKKWILTSKLPLYNENGEVVGLLGIGHDITKRKLSEELLRESEERLRSIYENATIGIYRTTPEGKIEMANPALVKMLGFESFEELAQRNLSTTGFELHHPRSDFQSLIKKNGIVEGLESAWYRKDGTIVYVSESARAIYDSANEAIHYDGIVEDITERKIAEDKIKVLTLSVEQNPVAIVITDPEGKIEYVNPKFCSATGYTAEEAMGKNPRILKSGEKSKDEYENLWNTILSGNVWIGEFHNRRKNGELYWEKASISPIVNENGDIAHFVAVKEDITEKKKILEELITAKEKAEKSEKLKSEFLAQMSHEIRSPLNIVMSMANLIKEEYPGTMTKDIQLYFQGIEASGKRIIRTIDLIINASEMQVGTYQPIFKRIDLMNSILVEIQREYQPIADEKSLDFGIDCKVSRAFILADEYSVRQIFTNLIDNAIKFTDAGRVQILIYQTPEEQICACVEDTGIGISPDFMKNLFIPFGQEDHGYTRKFEGNGLGLSVVKRFCDLNNAKISVESTKGEGSKFTVSFQLQGS
ncbi:MAG: hypothetical protein FD178_2721 [Ignavibacteria bacterium]|nr:MAG: hypothetical protein FD178_2721 [Ignavibacteria bacterium]